MPRLSLNLSACKNLTTLNIESFNDALEINEISPLSLQELSILEVTMSVRGLLLTLPSCKHLSYLFLGSVSDSKVVNILVDVLPRLTRLQKIVLCSKNTDVSGTGVPKLSLNLSACKNLTTLNIESVNDALEINEISPLSLQELSILEVTMSVRGLLLTLPSCKHLSYLFLGSVSDSKVVNILVDVLPRLTRLQKIVLCSKNTEIEAVAKLQGLEISYHDI